MTPRIVRVARPEGIWNGGARFTTSEGIWITGAKENLIDNSCIRFIGIDGSVRSFSLPDDGNRFEPIAGGDFAFACTVADEDGYIAHYAYYKHVGGDAVRLFTNPDEQVSFHDREDACVRGQDIFTCSSGTPLGRFSTDPRSSVYPTPTGWLLRHDLLDPDEDAHRVAGFTLTGELAFDRRMPTPHFFDGNAHIAYQDYARGDLVVLETARGTEVSRIDIGENYQTLLTSAGDVVFVEHTRGQLTPYRNGERGEAIAVPGTPFVSGPIAYIDELWDEGTLVFVLPR